MVALPFLLIAIIKLVFQYIITPSAWIPLFRHYNEPPPPLPENNRVEMIEGAISPETLRTVLETVIGAVSSNRAAIEPVVRENMLEAAPPVPMKRKLHTQMSGVELLDDPDQEDSGTASNESGISNESCDKIKVASSSSS